MLNLNISDLINFGKSYSDSLIKQINNPCWSDVIKHFSSVEHIKELNTTTYWFQVQVFIRTTESVILMTENMKFYTEVDFYRKYNIKTI